MGTVDHVKKGGLSKKVKVLIAIVLVLVVARIALPYVVLHYANKSLAKVPGYYGHIEDIGISLYRGAYQVNNIYLDKKDTLTGKQTEFFKARSIDLSVEWKALFNGSIVGELEFESPKLVFTKDKVEIKDVQKDTSDFRKILKDFMPLKINRFEIVNGNLFYLDKTSKPKVDVALKETYVLATNLTNATEQNEQLPSTVTARANAYEGTLAFNMKLNALAEKPTFDLNCEIKNTNLVLLNDFFKAYGKVDINKGTFGLYTEFAAKEGRFEGYVKPVIKDLDVLGPEDRKDSFLQKAWEAVAGTGGVILKNPKKDQVATKLSIDGEFESPKTHTMEAVWQVLKNAFIQAINPSIDNQINIHTVGTEKKEDKRSLIKRILSPKKDNDKDEKKK